jgi:hypothetical protein
MANGTFADEQADLKARIEARQATFVYRDPVQGWGEWIMVVVKAPTGVIYGNQCMGVATHQRYVEGFLVPLGPTVLPGSFSLSSAPLRAVFHRGTGCLWLTGPELSDDRRAALEAFVAALTYWEQRGLDEEIDSKLRLDLSRVDEIAEAWVPVVTPHGPGVLLFDNCD